MIIDQRRIDLVNSINGQLRELGHLDHLNSSAPELITHKDGNKFGKRKYRIANDQKETGNRVNLNAEMKLDRYLSKLAASARIPFLGFQPDQKALDNLAYLERLKDE